MAVDSSSPRIFEQSAKLWNIDDSSVDVEFGERDKAFGSSDGHNGGFRASSYASGKGKHVTAVIAVSAAGFALP